MNEPKMSLLRTHLRRWEHQQGWRTSEQPPWPGGPGAQQQPHPPAKGITFMKPIYMLHFPLNISYEVHRPSVAI